MFKKIAIISLLFTIIVGLSGCVTAQGQELESEYIEQATSIFQHYLDEEYPDGACKLIETKTFTSFRFEFDGFEFIVEPSTLVEGTLRHGLFKTEKIYCFVDDESHTIYTNKYFEDVKSSVHGYLNESLSKKDYHASLTISLYGIETGILAAPSNLFPINIRNAQDLFSCTDENIYSLKMNVTVKDGVLFDMDYAYLFNDVHNRWTNKITCNVNDGDEFVDVALHSNSRSYSVTYKTRNQTETVGGLELNYNDHFFMVTVEQVRTDVKYDKLLDEEKEFLKNQWKVGRVKAWHSYDIVVRPKYDKDVYQTCSEEKELPNGEKIVYSYINLMRITYKLGGGDIGKYRLSDVIGQYHGGSYASQQIDAARFLKNGATHTFHLDVFEKIELARNTSWSDIPYYCEKYYRGELSTSKEGN